MSATLLENHPEAVSAARPELLAFERRKSRLLRLWIATGIFFMILPGTILGVANLLLITAHHGFQGLSPAWIQAHGHAQAFGWIGSFVIGIGFYSQPRARANSGFLPIICWLLWTFGLTLRWLAGAYLWHWRITFPLAGALELAALIIFLYAATQHKLPQKASQFAAPHRSQVEPWMQVVLVGNLGMLAAIAINFVISIQVALAGTTPARPHHFDPKFLVLLGWGFLAPLIWGFSARWLPTFLGVSPVRARLLQLAVAIDIVGVGLGFTSHARITTSVLAVAAVLAAFAIRVFSPSQRPPKIIGIHPSFPAFLRIAYAWSIIAACIGIWAAFADHHNGIWGGSRHALTVGFAAMMVLTVGPRILPHFAGVRAIYSSLLMFITNLLLLIGCTLRVSMEPLAYEGYVHFAWKLLPLSGCLELAAVLLFALQLVLTFTRMPGIFAQPTQA